MRREIIAAASVLALMTGVAMAQSTAPGTGNPAAGGPTATEKNQTGKSQADMNKAGSTAATQTPANQTATTGASSLTGGQMASAEHMMGKNVYGKDNEKLGEVDDIILDSNGQAKQLVISSGGFLGIGERKIAVDVNQANWDQNQNRIQLSGMTRDDVKNMPEFQYSDTTTSLNRNKDKAGSTTNDAASRSSTGTANTPTAPSGTTGTPSGDKSGQ
ncbi:PRC-barrel domain-containing protein [Azospirillum sp. sgz302134]